MPLEASAPARKFAQISPKRIPAQGAASCVLAADGTAAFVYLVRQKIETADMLARESYVGAVISEIRVGDHKVQIIGDNRRSPGLSGRSGASSPFHSLADSITNTLGFDL